MHPIPDVLMTDTSRLLDAQVAKVVIDKINAAVTDLNPWFVGPSLQ